MLSIAAIGAGAGAAEYYAGDNYYTSGQLTEASAWAGQGAELLGLAGAVDGKLFEAVLAGQLPGGSVIPDGARGAHRPGLDLTFSAPKSVSLLAYVGGDTRLLAAHRDAVATALGWAEANFAEARVAKGRGQATVATGNLLIAQFEHDTSRALDPQAHIHAVIANATRAPDGKWRALAEFALWSGKTAIASVYNAEFRQRVEALGYTTQTTAKHGQFEIAGVPRAVIEAFSQRRAAIEQAATKLMHNTPAALAAVTLRTRGAKPVDIDRDVLNAEWRTRAAGLGFDAGAMVAEARRRAAHEPAPWARLVEGIRGAAAQAQALAERLGLLAPGAGRDALVPEPAGALAPLVYAAAHAVASAVRHLSEREAGFGRVELVKAALDLGAPVSVAAIEDRIASLAGKGLLLAGADGRMMTTAAAWRQETAYLAALRQGQGQVRPLLPKDTAAASLKAEAQRQHLKLTAGQAKAATSILTSSDRVVHVQGNAGTGKSAMLVPVARLAEAHGHAVIGLAVSNAVANRLKAEVSIAGGTVASFVRRHAALLEPAAPAGQRAAAAAALNGALIIVDEASMLGTRDAAQLVAIANAANAGRLALIGDVGQLGAVEAGKPFALGHDAATVVMDQNLRARTPEMRALHDAAQAHDVARLAALIKPHTTEVPGTAAATAAAMWFTLPAAERARTEIFVSGRALRAAVNREVQALRRDAGELGTGARITGTLVPVHLTREEQKLARSYRAGQVIELARPLTSQGLPQGTMQVLAVDSKGAVAVRLTDGRSGVFRPARLAGNRVDAAVRVFERRDIELHAGDPVRWTTTDRARGLDNNGRATLERREPDALLFRTADDRLLRLDRHDPMLKRLDLAYAVNAHPAQGSTADRAIVVANSSEGPLINRALAAVLITRAREHVSLVVDSLPGVERRLQANSGEKTAAVEIAVVARLDPAAAQTAATVRASVEPPMPPAPVQPAVQPLERTLMREPDFGL